MTDGENFVLSARGVRKSFKAPGGSSIEVLRGVCLDIRAGESVSLRGESGAGKTTLMNVVAGLESPDGGEVWWEGARADALSNSAQARLRAGFMGFVFQNYCLVPELTALENVEFAARICGAYSRAASRRARELLESVGLGGRLNYLPGRLSGGERQRVAIARALLNRPRILLADEPTGNLDEDTANSVMDILLSLGRENSAALLLITHNPAFAKMTSREVLLTKGGIVEIR